MTKDIKPLIAIYTILILSCWNMAISYKATKQLTELKQEVFEVKKITVEINTEKNEYIKILQESRAYLNNEIDLLNDEIKQYKAIEKLTKDLRLNR